MRAGMRELAARDEIRSSQCEGDVPALLLPSLLTASPRALLDQDPEQIVLQPVPQLPLLPLVLGDEGIPWACPG